jgi:hypothetical protein
MVPSLCFGSIALLETRTVAATAGFAGVPLATA